GAPYHAGSAPAAAGTAPPQPAASSPAPTSKPATPSVSHRVTVRVRRSHGAHAARRGQRRSLTVLGSVVGAHDGRVLLRFERKRPHRGWRRSLSLRVSVGRNGRFQRALATRSLGRWR